MTRTWNALPAFLKDIYISKSVAAFEKDLSCITFILIWLRQLDISDPRSEPLKLYVLNVSRLVWLTRSPLNCVASNCVNLTWLPVGFLIFLYCFRVPVIGGFASVGIPCHSVYVYICFSVIVYFSLSLVYNFVLAKLINK